MLKVFNRSQSRYIWTMGVGEERGVLCFLQTLSNSCRFRQQVTSYQLPLQNLTCSWQSSMEGLSDERMCRVSNGLKDTGQRLAWHYRPTSTVKLWLWGCGFSMNSVLCKSPVVSRRVTGREQHSVCWLTLDGPVQRREHSETTVLLVRKHPK